MVEQWKALDSAHSLLEREMDGKQVAWPPAPGDADAGELASALVQGVAVIVPWVEPDEDKRADEILAIDGELYRLDLASIRALSAIELGEATSGDRERLETIAARKAELRERRNSLLK